MSKSLQVKDLNDVVGNTKGWRVHHLFQHADKNPDVAKWYYDNTGGKGIHDLDNLRYVPQPLHDDITQLQNQFWLPYRERYAADKGLSVSRVKIADVVRSGEVNFKDYQKHVRELTDAYKDVLLKPTATANDVKKLAKAAQRRYGVRKLGDFAKPRVITAFNNSRTSRIKELAGKLAKYGIGAFAAGLYIGEANQAFASPEWRDFLDQYALAAQDKLDGHLSNHRNQHLQRTWSAFNSRYPGVVPDLWKYLGTQSLLLNETAGYGE